MTQGPSLWDQLVVAVVGGIVTAVVGTLAVGVVLQQISRNSQDRREASVLRQHLVAELTEVAGKASIALSFYQRLLKNCAESANGSGSRLVERRLHDGRQRAEAHHMDSRVRGWVIEKRLEVHYGKESTVTTAWHRTLDGLNIRFLLLTDELSESVRDYQSMSDHTGLDSAAMHDYEVVREFCSTSLTKAAQLVLSTPMVNPRE